MYKNKIGSISCREVCMKIYCNCINLIQNNVYIYLVLLYRYLLINFIFLLYFILILKINKI